MIKGVSDKFPSKRIVEMLADEAGVDVEFVREHAHGWRAIVSRGGHKIGSIGLRTLALDDLDALFGYLRGVRDTTKAAEVSDFVKQAKEFLNEEEGRDSLSELQDLACTFAEGVLRLAGKFEE